ncbi:MAG: hypothetical protein ACJA08_003132 [Cyclobacteriaceae bacterium]|jgi:hypothetical protein
MLKIYCLTLLFIFPAFLYAQKYMDTHDPKSSDVKSLLGKDNEFAGFGGADLKMSTLKDDRTLLMGMYAGTIINRNYLFGIAGYGIVSANDFRGSLPGSTELKKLSLHGGYGGVLIGATMFTKEIIHLSFPILLGAGSIDVVDDKFLDNFTNLDVTIEKSAFFVIEPAAQIEINVTKKFRIAGGIAYRYVTASGFSYLENEDLTGLTSTLSLRFGRY